MSTDRPTVVFDLDQLGTGYKGGVRAFHPSTLTDGDYPHLVPMNPDYVFDNKDAVRILCHAWNREWKRPEGRHRKGVYLFGPTGAGKSSIVEQLFARMGVPLVRSTWSPKRDASDMLSSKTLADGKIIEIDQAIAIAARRGLPVKIDEIDLADPSELVSLNDIIEQGVITLPSGEVIVAERGFMVFATANTAGVDDETGTYHGTRSLNASTLRRFFSVEVGYPTEAEEASFLAKVFPTYTQPLLDRAAKVVTMIRSAAAGTLDGKRLTFPISRPETVDWIEMMSAFSQVNFENTNVAQYSMGACFANRLPNADREVVTGIVESVFGS